MSTPDPLRPPLTGPVPSSYLRARIEQLDREAHDLAFIGRRQDAITTIGEKRALQICLDEAIDCERAAERAARSRQRRTGSLL